MNASLADPLPIRLELQHAQLRTAAKLIDLVRKNIPSRCDTEGADDAMAGIDYDVDNVQRKLAAALALVEADERMGV
jgi:hypothetical protein